MREVMRQVLRQVLREKTGIHKKTGRWRDDVASSGLWRLMGCCILDVRYSREDLMTE